MNPIIDLNLPKSTLIEILILVTFITIIVFFILRKFRNRKIKLIKQKEDIIKEEKSLDEISSLAEIKRIKENQPVKVETAIAEPMIKEEKTKNENYQSVDQESFKSLMKEDAIIYDLLDEATIQESKEMVKSQIENLVTKVVEYDIAESSYQKNPSQYALTKFPLMGCIVRSFQRGKSMLRGYKEESFENALKTYFSSSFTILGDACLVTSNISRPYEPDIAIIDTLSGLNIRIDIEIDEPYAALSRCPCHCKGDDDQRDLWFIHRGWVVIRFTEKQVHLQSLPCLAYISSIIKRLNPKYEIPLKLLPYIYGPILENQWTDLEAQKMAENNIRENYLNISAFKENKTVSKSEVHFTEQEQKEENLVVPYFSNSDVENPNFTSYNLLNKHLRDDLIDFYPKEHLYFVNSVKFTPISTVISRFFPVFDTPYWAEKKAKETNVPIRKKLEEWDSKGCLSRECGTFLHDQIEQHFLGNQICETYSFNYEGEYYKGKRECSLSTEVNHFKNFLKENPITPFRTEWRIFDSKNQIAGTIDLLALNENGYEMYDWKRSEKIIVPAPGTRFQNEGEIVQNIFQKGFGELHLLQDSSFNHYCLQQNLYRYILKNNYGIDLKKMYLVVLHPSYGHYIKVEVPIMQKDIDYLLNNLN